MLDRAVLTAQLMGIMTDHPELGDFPARLCAACVEVLPVDGVGISLMLRDSVAGRVVLAASDDRAARIEELQFSLGEGPCVSAFSEARPVLVPDIRAADARARWPIFASELGEDHDGAVFAFPLQVGSIGIGVLDCHRHRPGSLAEVGEALLVAEVLTLVLLDFQARGVQEHNGGGELFDVSWRSHAEIHQATGMIAAQLGVTMEVGFVRLRAYAFRHRLSLTAVADEILSRRLRLGDQEH
jgi:hypothetical protein